MSSVLFSRWLYPVFGGAGLLVGLAAGGAAPAVLGAILGVVIGFLMQAGAGLREARIAGSSVPIDLSTPMPDPLTVESYAALSLAGRNAVVVRLGSRAANAPEPEYIGLLPELLGRQRVSTIDSQRRAAAIWSNLDPAQVDAAAISSVCAAELKIAGEMSIPPNDRIRTIVERNFGRPVNASTMSMAILTSKVGTGQSVAELVEDAQRGRADLAFVVGTIRKVGEWHAREMAKIR